jgi:hypothetical protein
VSINLCCKLAQSRVLKTNVVNSQLPVSKELREANLAELQL